MYLGIHLVSQHPASPPRVAEPVAHRTAAAARTHPVEVPHAHDHGGGEHTHAPPHSHHDGAAPAPAEHAPGEAVPDGPSDGRDAAPRVAGSEAPHAHGGTVHTHEDAAAEEAEMLEHGLFKFDVVRGADPALRPASPARMAAARPLPPTDRAGSVATPPPQPRG